MSATRSKHTFTKGPWETLDGNFVYQLNSYKVNRFCLSVQTGFDDNGKRISKDEVAAITALIAAAPALYEALDNLNEATENYLAGVNLPTIKQINTLTEALRHTRSALAQARGEARR